MKTSLSSLKNILLTNVAEIKFARRNVKPGQGKTRRMLCTNSPMILDSLVGRAVFKYSPPTQSPPYNAAQHNLVLAFDLFKMNYRAINIESVDVISVIPVATETDVEEFWNYFSKNIAPMSPADKEKFINT